MIEKFSVRKPFTVLVGIILIIVLGVVSFTNTSTDLLPSMDLPFSAVFTTYIGATPEQVERDVSIPKETALSTLSGIQTVQSISNEHVSIVILEFTGTTNMDSASLEIREALDMMSLPDGAGRPSVIRMNPDMLPIMTANISMAGVEIDELSEFARSTVAPALEGVPGVAVVNLSGLVQNQLHIIIRDELVRNVNATINAHFHAMMAQMQAQMEAVIGAQVEGQMAIWAAERIPELMGEGYTFDEAQAQIAAETPAVAGQMAAEIAAAMAAEAPDMGDMPTPGIPPEMLTVGTIADILTAQNFAMPAGMITDGGAEHMVRVGDRFENLEEIGNMLIFDPAMMGLTAMEPIRLSDIAEVFPWDNSGEIFTRVNGNPSVMFSIQGQSEFTTADITNAVRDRMDALEGEHPGLNFAVLMDQGEMIGMIISSVLDSLIIGGILAILVLLIFLRDIRPTLIVAVSIPVSLMLAFTLMYFTGVSLNMISMSGLALTVGMLVDNSIVVIENIFRIKAKGEVSAARAAVIGTRQVSGAIAAATLTTTAMFLPIVFTSGLTRQIFADLGLTIAYALLASLAIAMTVVPAASAVMLKNVKKEQEGRFFTKFVDGYERALRWSLRFKWLVLAFSLVAFVVSIMMIGRQGMEMFPDMDMPQITVSANLPEGATFEEAAEAAGLFADWVLLIDDVETVGVSVGGGGMMAMLGGAFGMGGGGGTNIEMNILLYEDRNISFYDLSNMITYMGESLGLEVDVMGADGGMGMMMGQAISVRIEGHDLDDMRATGIAVAEIINTVPGAINVTDLTIEGASEIRIRVDKDAAMAHGLTVAQVFLATNAAISAPERSLHMTFLGRGYEILVKDGNFIEPDRAAIENMQIQTPTGYVNLSAIAEIYDDLGFTTIGRYNRNRFITISGELAEGYNVTLVNNEIEARLADFVPIAGNRVVIGGEAEMIQEAFADLILMLVLGLLFTYLIMVAQFQSLLSPFIIMLTLPLAFTGGFAALMIIGMPLSIVAMIGLILLAGVAINNGIVLVSRITQDRWDGMSKRDAIIDAGRKRIRPILMTAISTIFAMSVLALGIGEGTEMMQPMAVATIGGLLYCTIMTLFVVPIMYDILHRNKDITQENLDDEVVEIS